MTESPRLLAGLPDQQVADTLRGASTRFTNLTGAGHQPLALWTAYLQAVGEQAQVLRGVLREDTVNRYLFGPGYDRLVALRAAITTDPSDHAVDAALRYLLDAEIAATAATLDNLRRAVDDARRPTRGGPTVYVVPDTNILVSRPDRPDRETLADIPWSDLLASAIADARPSQIRVLLPLLVLDELDGLKDRARGDGTRRQARHLLRDLNHRLADQPQDQPVTLHDGNHQTPINVSLELVFDDDGHHRLPSADDELVAVARRLHALRGRTIHVLTADLHMATRARRYQTSKYEDHTELRVHLLTHAYDPDTNAPPGQVG